ncbi:hypothetical protein A3K63_02225 [Candidatus Micrarchaeota archaeon RBG_16_49_10]|nr:MAG: hypothetical protein A3K63_02225 [Candidatus Micrarchaeota archaeon RBG_16_49_10]
MRVSYDRDVDIMLIEASEEKIDFAEEFGSIIVPFTKDRKPVLLEILDASEFISNLSRILMKIEKGQSVPLES